MFERSKATLATAAFVNCFLVASAEAQVTAASGFIYSSIDTGIFHEGCMQQGPGGIFAGLGPQFTSGVGGLKSIVFVSESGDQRTVATGLNAVADCLYDAQTDVLYVIDNALEYTDATAGDTVFALPDASISENLAVADHELAASGSIPAAASIGFDENGDLLVSDASGGGAGSVLNVAVSDGSISSFIAASFDFVGGLALEADGSVLVAEAEEVGFTNAIYRYDAAGALIGTVANASYAHGSLDLALGIDGLPVVTGNNTIARIDGPDASTLLVTGIEGNFGAAFGSGVDVDPFTGRIVFGASNFDGGEADRSIHQLVPVSELIAGRGNESRECIFEYYGARLVPKKEGAKAKRAICVDGEPCDADGVANGSCQFPIGLCVGVEDERLPDCSVSSVDAVELLRIRPESPSIAAAATRLSDNLVEQTGRCTFSDGYVVPLRVSGAGQERKGRGKIKVRASATVAGRSQRDVDALRLECLPAS